MFQQNPVNAAFKTYLLDNAEALHQQINGLTQSILNGEQVIWNKEFNLLPTVVFIDSETCSRFAAEVEQYHLILQKVLKLYRQHQSVRDFFGFDTLVEELCVLDSGLENEIVICRFDSYPTPDGFKLLENNTDCPAGVLFTHRHSKAIAGLPLIASFINEYGPVAQTRNMTDMGFFDTLFDAHKARTGRDVEHALAILQLEKGVSAEVKLMMEVMAEKGIECVIADPRNLIRKDGALWSQGKRIDVIWNKINTCYFNELLEDAEQVSGLLEAVKSNEVTHVNSFTARYVTESKRSLALLCAPEFAHLFDEQERKIIESLLPWACCLSADRVNYKGQWDSAFDIAVAFKDELVLKQPYDIRGDGVVLGKQCTQDQWQEMLVKGLEAQSILQACVDVAKVEVLDPLDGQYRALNSSLDFFMYNGHFAGFGSKLSEHLKVNIFQGGSKNVVLPLA
ncbi:MAG: circularly permuted type 2 ATP-grasp protein [Reinekea sp.]